MGMAQRGEFIHGMDDAESLELPIAEQVAQGAEVDFRILQQLVHGEDLLPCRQGRWTVRELKVAAPG